MKKKLVVIGNGMAGMRAVEELLKIAPDLYDITVFGAEPYGNYNRIMLSPVLCGEKSIPDIMINDLAWYQAHNIRLHAGKDKKIVHIDRRNRMVQAADGKTAPYDRLLLATGSIPHRLPVPGKDLTGVIAFRTIEDVETMLEAAHSGGNAVVIGGGLLGLEAASGLLKQGMDVTVVHHSELLMNRQLDEAAARLLQQSLEDRGLKFRMKAVTTGITDDGTGHCRAVTFADGSDLSADLVVMTTGVRPNTELARNAGLQCDQGILVNDTLQTYDPAIYAIGECIQHRGAVFGLVAPIWDQARVCANHLASYGTGIYNQQPLSTRLKVTGINLFSAGEFNGDDESEEIVLRDPSQGLYKKLILKNDRVIGSVLYGDTQDGSWYFQLMKDQTSVAAIREALIFGPAHSDSAAGQDLVGLLSVHPENKQITS